MILQELFLRYRAQIRETFLSQRIKYIDGFYHYKTSQQNSKGELKDLMFSTNPITSIKFRHLFKCCVCLK